MIRTKEELREHYDVEKELAERLRNAPRKERGKLYSSIYDELFRRVPHHPQLKKKNALEPSHVIQRRLKFIRHYTDADTTFLEIGSGDCNLSTQIAAAVKHVYAADVSDEITKSIEFPDNLTLILSDGVNIPAPEESIDVAFSNQLLEHLHPDDAEEQLRNICKALKPGGIYICLTPNRLYGPHDISKHFDKEAAGLHLKEYTNRELCRLFKNCGFERLSILAGARGSYLPMPPILISAIEHVLEILPFNIRRIIAGNPVFRIVLGCRIIGRKPR